MSQVFAHLYQLIMKIIANGGCYRGFSQEGDNSEHSYTVSGRLSIRLNAFSDNTSVREQRERGEKNVQQTLNHGRSRMHANTKRNWVELEKGEGRIKPVPRRLSQS